MKDAKPGTFESEAHRVLSGTNTAGCLAVDGVAVAAGVGEKGVSCALTGWLSVERYQQIYSRKILALLGQQACAGSIELDLLFSVARAAPQSCDLETLGPRRGWVGS